MASKDVCFQLCLRQVEVFTIYVQMELECPLQHLSADAVHTKMFNI